VLQRGRLTDTLDDIENLQGLQPVHHLRPPTVM
jgi:hypothetical protein